MNALVESLDSEMPVFCPICMKAPLLDQNSYISCSLCAIKLVVYIFNVYNINSIISFIRFRCNNSLEIFFANIQQLINKHADQCSQNLVFFTEPDPSSIELFVINAVCYACEYMCMIN